MRQTLLMLALQFAQSGAVRNLQGLLGQLLLPLRILRLRTLAASNLSALIATAAVFSQFFLLTLYMQQVLHYSALKTGVAYVGLTVTTIALSASTSTTARVMGTTPSGS